MNNMKIPKGGPSGGWLEPRTIKLTIFAACLLLLPSCYLYGTKTDAIQPVVNLQASLGKGDEHEKVLVVKNHERENKTEESAGDLREEQNLQMEEDDLGSQTSNSTQGTVIEGLNEEDRKEEEEVNIEEPQPQNNTIEGSQVPDSRIECDFSQVRTDICELHGDVRVHGPSSSVLLVSSNGLITSNHSTPITIRPYARKWEGPTMELIKNVSISSTTEPASNSLCTVNYSAPAVVFSTGAFRNNYFHEIVDALIPVFLTSYQFHGDVHFLIEDFSPDWIKKYRPVLDSLSRHEFIDLDTDTRVHCFSHVIVGTRSSREMGIDPATSPNGVSMLEFKAVLRSSFGLPREFVFRPATGSGRKPRLLFLSRKGSRVLINEREVLRMVRSLGYKVVVAGPEQTKNITLIAPMVNSCDVLLGVHGAGLTNMVFLPANATMIQIIPWGEMLYPCRFSYGEPAIGMGLRYLDYEINQNETSLINKYPRDHAVFTDPLSIHIKGGFRAIWSIFLHQDITLDVERFRPWLSKALNA